MYQQLSSLEIERPKNDSRLLEGHNLCTTNPFELFGLAFCYYNGHPEGKCLDGWSFFNLRKANLYDLVRRCPRSRWLTRLPTGLAHSRKQNRWEEKDETGSLWTLMAELDTRRVFSGCREMRDRVGICQKVDSNYWSHSSMWSLLEVQCQSLFFFTNSYSFFVRAASRC